MIEHRDRHPTPAPRPGKSLLYFSDLGIVRIGLNGNWIGGSTRGNRYFFVEIEPGFARFCMDPGTGDLPAALYVRYEAGKAYYHFGKQLGTSDTMSHAQAEQFLSKKRYVTFEAR
jgi:hypothetical protein